MSKGSEGGREKLMRVASQQFAEFGFSEVSVGKIISASGVGPPTLYHHFDDKEGLYLAWVLQAMESAGASIREAVAKGTPEQALRDAAKYLITTTEFDLLQVVSDKRLMRRESTVESIYRAIFQSIYEPLFAVVVQASILRSAPIDRVDRLAHQFVMGALAFHPRHALQPGDPDVAADWWSGKFLLLLG